MAKSINLDIIRKLMKYSLKKILVKAVINFTVFETLLFEARLTLRPTQWVIASQEVKSLIICEKHENKEIRECFPYQNILAILAC